MHKYGNKAFWIEICGIWNSIKSQGGVVSQTILHKKMCTFLGPNEQVGSQAANE